jgi:hypothetical protein
MFPQKEEKNMASRILAVEYCSLDSLRLSPLNPRLHNKKQVRQIARSIETFGFNVPVLIDGRGQVIAGHGRVLAAQLLGMIQVPTIRLEHLTEVQLRAFTIADNRLTENSVWDERLLVEQLKSLSVMELDFRVDVTGFEMGEIEMMIEGPAPIGRDKNDAKAILESGAGPQVTQAGDVWVLNRRPVRRDDALDDVSNSILMRGQRAAAVLSDLRYVDTVVRRWQNSTGMEAVHQGTGQTFAQREKEIADAQH